MQRLAAVRAGAQGLAGGEQTVVDAVAQCAGVQAQDLPASRLAVRARSTGLTAADVRSACDADRTVVRTWAMRGTLHAVPAVDLRWLVALLGPVTVASYAKRRASLGLDDKVCAGLLDTAPAVLADGPLTRSKMVAAWNERGVAVNPKGQASAHAVLYAAAMGTVCRGPDRDAEPTYVLVDDWVADTARQPDPESDAAELARRHLRAFGPADARDFQSWSGLRAAAARAAVEAAADGSIQVGSRTLHTVGDAAEPATGWRLLPAFDTALLGHRDRAGLGSPPALAAVFAGGGWIHPAVLRAGQVVGSWRWRPPTTKTPGEVAVEVVDGLDKTGHQALQAEATDVGRFLGCDDVKLAVSDS